MITEKSDWVPLTTAATRLGCSVKDIHELVKEYLPAPDWNDEDGPNWERSNYYVGVSDKFIKTGVTIIDAEPGGKLHVGADAARDLAFALLAAADSAEKEGTDEKR